MHRITSLLTLLLTLTAIFFACSRPTPPTPGPEGSTQAASQPPETTGKLDITEPPQSETAAPVVTDPPTTELPATEPPVTDPPETEPVGEIEPTFIVDKNGVLTRYVGTAETVVIPENVKKIAVSAFSNPWCAERIKNLTMGGFVTVEKGAFANLTAIQTFTAGRSR